MSAAEDAAKFRQEYEECRAQAAKAVSLAARKQWQLFAEEWLKLAMSAEEQHRREAASDTPIGCK